MNFGRSIKVLAYDYETTGLDTATLGVLQAALIVVDLHQDGSYDILDQDCQLLNPGVEITAEATAIHGYSAMDVADKPCWVQYMTEQFDTVHALNIDAVFGYNNYSYDDKISMRVGWRPVFSIDMIKPCRALKKKLGWPGAKLVQSYEQLMGKPMQKAHDALADVTATLDLVAPAIKAAGLNTLDELIAWAVKDEGTPNMTMPFGKDKGSKLKNLEKDYVKWLLAKCETPMSFDLRKGLEACLA